MTEFETQVKNTGLPSSVNISKAVSEIRGFCRANKINISPSKEDIQKVNSLIEELYISPVLNSTEMSEELKEKVKSFMGGE